eukprot:1894558-Lingulodinium_polyedra.AAC.1
MPQIPKSSRGAPPHGPGCAGRRRRSSARAAATAGPLPASLALTPRQQITGPGPRPGNGPNRDCYAHLRTR